MNPKLSRAFGVTLVVAAVIGWLICLGALTFIWIYTPKISRVASQQVGVMKTTLGATVTGLSMTEKSLGAIVASMEGLQGTIQATANTVDATAPFLDGLIAIADKSLPDSMSGLQDSLSTAKEGAKVIDNVLGVINRVPLLSGLFGTQYDPDTPLSEGLDKVSNGLDSLDQTFSTMSTSLKNTQSSIKDVQSGIHDMAENIGEITANLKDAQLVIGQYQKTAQSLLDFLNDWGDRLPEIITLAAVIISLFFLWIALTQLGLFLQGLEYSRRKIDPNPKGLEVTP
jgi:methyl-accepting chemotaxis protein